MDYIVAYPTVNNVSMHCVIQEKEVLIERQQKEIEELRKSNQMLIKENEKLKSDLDLQKKLNEALEKFKYSLERHIVVLKECDRNRSMNRWSVDDAESEVRIWEHEYLMVRKTLEKKEKDQVLASVTTNREASQIGAVESRSEARRMTPKQRPAVDDGSNGKKYVCDFPNCDYRSNWPHDLKGHKRKHTGEKPYTCGWLNCNKSFRDLRDLKRHQRSHTGDKRYSCDWPGCDYRSTDVANLAKHKRTHTGEKPYKCDWSGCSASFADGSHLRRHQKKHENQIVKPRSGSNKRRSASNKNSVQFVKTRQQPARKAKGSTVPLEVILNISDAIADNDRCDHTSDGLVNIIKENVENCLAHGQMDAQHLDLLVKNDLQNESSQSDVQLSFRDNRTVSLENVSSVIISNDQQKETNVSVNV